MSDIVKHLRAGEPCGVNFDVCRMMNAESGCLCAIAADTIEARRAEVDRLTFALSAARMEIATLKDELAKARAEIERRVADINHLDTKLADALDELAKAKQP